MPQLRCNEPLFIPLLDWVLTLASDSLEKVRCGNYAGVLWMERAGDWRLHHTASPMWCLSPWQWAYVQMASTWSLMNALVFFCCCCFAKARWKCLVIRKTKVSSGQERHRKYYWTSSQHTHTRSRTHTHFHKLQEVLRSADSSSTLWQSSLQRVTQNPAACVLEGHLTHHLWLAK